MNFLFDAQKVDYKDFKEKLGALLIEAKKKKGKKLVDYAKETQKIIN